MLVAHVEVNTNRKLVKIMRKNPLNKGIIMENAAGIGTVTSEMVEARARELAAINGRPSSEPSEADYQQAKRELSGEAETDPQEESSESIYVPMIYNGLGRAAATKTILDRSHPLRNQRHHRRYERDSCGRVCTLSENQKFHWHMGGRHFRDYHLLLDEQGDQLFAMTDPIAERIRKIGGLTIKSIGHIARLQRVLDNDADYVDPLAMIAELADDNKTLAARLREAHNVCDEHRDVATASLIEVWIDETERRTWFLSETKRRA